MYSDTYGKQKASKSAKLKYFCQMCRKQCLDENGFRCHLDSEHHMKMMRQYNEDPDLYIQKFSDEFEEAFIELLQDKFKSDQISANKVFMEMIKKVDHVHLNGTKWTKLNEFIEYLVSQNQIQLISSSPQDSIIKYIDKTAKIVKQIKPKIKQLQTTNLLDKAIEQQIYKGQQQEKQVNENLISKQQQQQQQNIEIPTTISFSLPIQLQLPQINQKQHIGSIEVIEKKQWIEEDMLRTETNPNLQKLLHKIKHQQPFETQKQTERTEKTEIKEQEEFAWIHEGIIVKIIDKILENGKFNGKKGLIKRIENDYAASIEILKSNQRVVIDQQYLETVIPQVNQMVMILKDGVDRGKIGKLESLHMDNFSGSVYIEEEDKLLELSFDHFSKIKRD